MKEYKVIPTKGDERNGFSVVDAAGLEWVAGCTRTKADRIAREMSEHGFATLESPEDIEEPARLRDAADDDSDGDDAGRFPAPGALLLVLLLLLVSFVSCTTTQPISASGPTNGSKTGKSASVQLLGLTVTDGGSVKEAATAGGVHYVQTVDVRRTNLLGIYRRSVTIVTGE